MSLSGDRDYPPNWAHISKSIKERDGWACRNCGSDGPVLHTHHVVPLLRGGSNSDSNLITLCEQCHCKVHPHMNNRVARRAPGLWYSFPEAAIPGTEYTQSAAAEESNNTAGWEYQLFDEVIQNGLEETAALWAVECSEGEATKLDVVDDVVTKYEEVMDRVIELLEQVVDLCEEEFAEAFSPTSGEVRSDKVISVAGKAVSVHRRLVVIQCELDAMVPTSDTQQLHSLMVQLPQYIIQQCEVFYYSLHREVSVLMPEALSKKGEFRANLCWSLPVPGVVGEISEEIARLSRVQRSNSINAKSTSTQGGGCLGSALFVSIGIIVVALGCVA